jgi:hypothetical protein
LENNLDLQSGCAHASPRVLTALELDPFIEPLVNATRILSCLSPCELQGVGSSAAFKWLASLAANRAHELQSILNGHRPLYDTSMRSTERTAVIQSLPKG